MCKKMHRADIAAFLVRSVIALFCRNIVMLVDHSDFNRIVVMNGGAMPSRRHEKTEHGNKCQHGSKERRRIMTHRHSGERRLIATTGQQDHLPGHCG